MSWKKQTEDLMDLEAQGGNNVKKQRIKILGIIFVVVFTFCGCTEAEKVSYNLSQEADNFNDVRQITVINCIQGDVLFQMTGRMSIQPDPSENQLEVIVEYKEGLYKKHFIGLSDNVTYVVEDLEVDNVDQYSYTLNFNPKMWVPVKPGYVD